MQPRQGGGWKASHNEAGQSDLERFRWFALMPIGLIFKQDNTPEEFRVASPNKSNLNAQLGFTMHVTFYSPSF